jgi:hypothetical protein
MIGRLIPVLCAFFIAVSPYLNAEQHIKPFIMPSARAAGFGGIHAAQGDDFSSLFSNPAAFVGMEKQFSAAELSISLYGPVLELYDLLSSSDGLDISPLVGPGGFAAGVDIGGPLALGWIGGGMGLGVMNRTALDAKVSSSTIRPLVSEELLFLGGYSYRFFDQMQHKLDAGVLGKIYYRLVLNLESSVFNAAAIFNNIESRPLQTQLGLGLDLGIKYSFAENFSAALAAYDVFSPAFVTRYNAFADYGSGGSQSYATVTPRLAAGILYRIHNVFLDNYLSDFVIMLDYCDILDPFIALIPRNPLLNIRLGAEASMIRILSLRAGIADALPSMGFGLDLHVLQFDFAMRGKELGLDPGVQSVYAIDISLLFRY